MTYTLDINALTALFLGRGGVGERFEKALSERHTLTLNAVSYYELKRGLVLPRFARRLRQFEAFLTRYKSLPMDTEVLDIAVSTYQTLRADGAFLEDADIFMAAIATANDAVLVTRNLRHFERIEGLRLETWEQDVRPDA